LGIAIITVIALIYLLKPTSLIDVRVAVSVFSVLFAFLIVFSADDIELYLIGLWEFVIIFLIISYLLHKFTLLNYIMIVLGIAFIGYSFTDAITATPIGVITGIIACYIGLFFLRAKRHGG